MADEAVSVGNLGDIVVEDFYEGLSIAKISPQSHYTERVKPKPKELGLIFEEPVDEEAVAAAAEKIARSRRKDNIKRMLREKLEKRRRAV